MRIPAYCTLDNKIDEVKKAVIDDSTTSLTTTYSSTKIEELIEDIPGGGSIDDDNISTTSTFSSSKIRDLFRDLSECDSYSGSGSVNRVDGTYRTMLERSYNYNYEFPVNIDYYYHCSGSVSFGADTTIRTYGVTSSGTEYDIDVSVSPATTESHIEFRKSITDYILQENTVKIGFQVKFDGSYSSTFYIDVNIKQYPL